MKLFLKLLGLVTLFVIVAAIAFVALFDPNEYKQQIEQQVYEATGRKLDITGDIGLSFIPIGVELGQVELSNAEGFEQPVFARIESLVVKVQLVPLLQRKLEVDALSLRGLWLFLEVDNKGNNNWQDLAAADKADVDQKQASEPSSEAVGSGEQASPLAALVVNGIEIDDAEIQFDDRQNGRLLRVSEFSLGTGEIVFGKAFDVDMQAQFSQRQDDVEQVVTLVLNSKLTIQQNLKQFSLRETVLDIKAKLPQLQQQVMELALSMESDIDLDTEQVVLHDVVLDAAYMKLMLDATLSNWSDVLDIQGRLKTAQIDPREIAYRFAVELPSMQGPSALARLTLDAPFHLRGDELKTQPDIVLDDSNIDADIRLAMTSQALQYDIAIDSIDLNRYLPPPPPTAAGAPPADAPEQDLPIPVELLRSLDIAGNLRIGELKALEYDIDDLLITAKVKDGVAMLNPVSLGLLQGTITASTKLDVRKDVPKLAQTLAVAGVEIGSFADPIVASLVPKQNIKVTGKTSVDADITTAGTRVSQFKRNLSGRAVLDLDKVIADGLDVDFLTFVAVSEFLGTKSVTEKVTGLTNEYRPSVETAFNKVHVGFDIDKGVLNTKDLLLDSDRIDVTGKGMVNIVDETLDMNIVSDLTLYKVNSVTDKLADEPLPVHISGSWLAPKINVDTGPMKARFKREYTDKLQQKVDSKKDALQQKLDDKIDSKTTDKTDALEQKLDEKKDKARDELKDKLKGLFR